VCVVCILHSILKLLQTSAFCLVATDKISDKFARQGQRHFSEGSRSLSNVMSYSMQLTVVLVELNNKNLPVSYIKPRA